MRCLLALLALWTAAPAAAADPSCPDRPVPDVTWPRVDGEVRRAAPEAAEALTAFAFPPTLDDPDRSGVRTDGLVVVHDGAIVYERYGRDWSAAMRHLQWSATKTVTMLLTSIAVGEGLLSVDDSICDHVEVADPATCAITLRDLLEFGSGLAWRETYEGMSPTASSVIGLLFGDGQDGVVDYITAHPLRDAPGTSYAYSTGDTTLLMAVVHEVLTEAHGDDYAWELLFEPLGITSAVYETDRSGVPLGGSYLYLTPRDMARLGWFLHSDGCWGGERIVPEGWLARARQPAPTLQGRLADEVDGAVPGWNLWLNTTVEGIQDQRAWPDVEDGAYAALGHWGQVILVLPEADVVIARTGDDRVDRLDRNRLAALVMPLVEAAPERGEGAGGDAVAEGGSHGEAGAHGEAGTNGEGGQDDLTVEVVRVPDDPAARWADDGPRPEPADAPAAEPPDKYDLGLLRIASSFAAKEACSCRYVSGRSIEACEAYIQVSPNVARARFDDEDREVRARSLGLAKVVARYVDEQVGCRVMER